MNTTNIPRKRSVFISSSFEDLVEARWEIVKETLKIGHIPIGMEMFHAGEKRNLEVIHKHIAECDLFIILVGARLGSNISQTENTPFTEWEYDRAQELGKPIIAFLLKEEEYIEKRNNIPRNDPERNNDKSLDFLREKIQRSERIVEYFSYDNIADLRGKVSSAVPLEIKSITPPKGGWIPGELYDALVERVMFDVTVSRNPFFRRFADRLNQFGTLSQRTKIQDKRIKYLIQ